MDSSDAAALSSSTTTSDGVEGRLKRSPGVEAALLQRRLCESMGLVKRGKGKKKAALTSDAWSEIEARAKARNDFERGCSICLEPFYDNESNPSVLLSCSHCFHRNCLASAERCLRAGKKRACPMCRKEAYSAKVTKIPATQSRNAAATRIQAFARAFRSRRVFRKLLTKYYTGGRGSTQRRRIFLEKEIGSYGNQVLKDLVERSEELDALFAETDGNLQSSRRFFQSLETADAKKKRPDWVSVRQQAKERGEPSCAICMGALLEPFKKAHTRRKKVLLLSCSHEFHEPCLRALEHFDLFAKHLCPCCRSEYQVCDDDHLLRV